MEAEEQSARSLHHQHNGLQTALHMPHGLAHPDDTLVGQLIGLSADRRPSAPRRAYTASGLGPAFGNLPPHGRWEMM